jgi:hypothetical protein
VAPLALVTALLIGEVRRGTRGVVRFDSAPDLESYINVGVHKTPDVFVGLPDPHNRRIPEENCDPRDSRTGIPRALTWRTGLHQQGEVNLGPPPLLREHALNLDAPALVAPPDHLM